jgi:peptidyl-prolyl cis-trans isomerase B (cyclophilin B)
MFRIYFALLVALAFFFMGCNRPLADFNWSGDSIAPATLAFSNRSEKAETYQWDFGDGKRSEEKNPEHRFGNSGNYEITLTAYRGKKKRSTKKQIQISPPEKCLAEIQTPYGMMVVQLFDATPKHRDNFLKLAEEGYYDSLLFHRVISGFMIQGGDPESRQAPPGKPLGMGGPGYRIDAEFVDSLVHLKGALAAARQGDAVNPERKSSGSQFYLVQGQIPSAAQLDQIEARLGFRYPTSIRKKYLEKGGTPFLDRQYTVFGRVIEGLEVIDRIAGLPTGSSDRPKDNVWMTIRIIR